MHNAHPKASFVKKVVENTDSKLSVLLLGLESLSLSEFKRKMPLTYAYVIRNISMYMFNRKFP